MSESRNRPSFFGRRAGFPTTCWTAIGDVDLHETLKARLYEQYWDPLYCYARRKGFSKEDAGDFTQGFLAEILLGREFLSKADRARGRFRSLLVKAFQNYVGMILRKKRVRTGTVGDVSASEVPEAVPRDPAAAFDYTWAARVLDGVLVELESECERDGLHSHWSIFQQKVMTPILDGTPAPSLAEICDRHGVASKTQASNMIVTVKRRFRRILVRHLTEQGNSEAEDEDALDDFLSIFAGS